jgi:hypothetical protein
MLAVGNVYLRPVVQGDAPVLSTFFQKVFQVPSTTMLLDDRHMAWKYWSDREDWVGPRSFAACHSDAIVAHVATWPVRILVRDRVLIGTHVIDWAADPAYPGAGIWLMRRVRPTTKTELLIATGGTEMTRRTLPVLGFRPFGEICCFARPVRPLAQVRSTKEHSWRVAGRLARNSAWRWAKPTSAPAGWSASPISPDSIDESVWPAPRDQIAVTVRDARFYRYVLESPVTRHTLFGVRRHGELAGYFCLASARHVARIADIWVNTTSADDWCAAICVAYEAAAQASDVHEVNGWSSTELVRQAFLSAGFRLSDRLPLSVFGDAAPLAGRDLHIQMLDSDASFVAADEVCYLM